jgi:hypothetical protein
VFVTQPKTRVKCRVDISVYIFTGNICRKPILTFLYYLLFLWIIRALTLILIAYNWCKEHNHKWYPYWILPRFSCFAACVLESLLGPVNRFLTFTTVLESLDMTSRGTEKNQAQFPKGELSGCLCWVSKQACLMYKSGKKTHTVGKVSFVSASQHDQDDPMVWLFKCADHVTREFDVECMITSEKDCCSVLVQVNPDTTLPPPSLPFHCYPPTTPNSEN